MKQAVLFITFFATFASVFAQSARSKIVFYDDFYDNAKSWQTGSSYSTDVKIGNGFMSINHKRDKGFTFLNRHLNKFSASQNYTIEAKFQHLKGTKNAPFGIAFGRNNDNNQFIFLMSSNGYYKIRSVSYGSKSALKKWTASSYIRKGQYVSNTLKVKKDGWEWKFYINGNFVASMPSQSWKGNNIAIAVGMRQKVSVDYISVKQAGGTINYNRPTVYKPKTNTPPQITIIEPYLGRGFKPLSRQSLKIVGTVTDSDGIAGVTINGMRASLDYSGRFELDVPLAYGENNIRVEATDKKQKVSFKTFSVNRKGQAQTNLVQDKRIALLIGNGDYQGGGDLPNPVNDVRAMQRSLASLGFEVLKYENCDKKSLLKAIDEFGRRLPGHSVGLVFYAGHGIQVDGENYLVPTDARLSNKNDVNYDCVATGRILGRLEDSGTKTNIVILDACRDNPFERSWSRSTKGSGLAFMNAPSGTLVAYATSPGATAADGSGSNGVYTEALLQTIQTPNLTIEEVFKRVRSRVKERTGGKQTPWESTSLEGSFYFKR